MLKRNQSYRDHVPAGWRPLFDQLVLDLHTLDPTLAIVQAKQKFGELRVYLELSSPRASKLIGAATRESKKTCEVCGADAGPHVTRGYYRTLCAVHRTA
jgi:hypothetical protein